jgi:four helix bundle protein
VTYETWEATVPEKIRAHPLWDLRVYRAALYAGELARGDAAIVARQGDLDDVANQMARATRSISANIAEGYSRRGRRDRGRFYEYALGSARESRDWYYKARDVLGEETTHACISLHTSLVRILTVFVRKNRPDTAPAPTSGA